MEKLNNSQLKHLRAVLIEREAALRTDMKRGADDKEEYAQVASEVPDPGDASFANLEVDLGNAAVGRELNELRAIEVAQARMENGSYGECMECGFPIPYERLEAQPTAERCAPCQEMYEKTHADAAKGATL
ncbi:MAG: TraR/DksA family transcriptional regulator [Herminiimonas sp.]|nr:TraR/DksA family transcriptional regulator [Herminiimonas sp.]MDB5852764.1 TraR/DksA family transcriptional regulator [Herminiimonas sp.]